VHCHNDFGMAVANTLAAVENGAGAISTTINGIGERCGNAATEECAMALALLYGEPTRIRLDRLSAVCQLVAEHAQVPLPANKAVVGANSFRHESGVHVAAMLREPACYEPYDPALVGARRSYVLGKTSGRAVLRHLAAEHGVDLDDEQCASLMEAVKRITDGGGTVDSERLRVLIEGGAR
jgi:isopropylmalate/homocitrate/citramalate synthase